MRAQPPVLTVSQLTQQLKGTVEKAFSRVVVKGEVSGFRGANARGHLYFALKDEFASIDVKVWESTAKRLRFALKDGLSLIAEGSLDVYEPQGRYSLIASKIEPAGLGALALAFEQLKAKLLAEGLFGDKRKTPKRPLPLLPRRIGVVTSVSGAALKDFLKVLHRRHPRLSVLVADARVQGDGASLEIARALKRMYRQQVDVIVVTRGGGSVEDLWAFNEELVVRTLAESPVPTVSAIGHEVDTTLSDFVADVRAPTPSAAAELIAPVLSELELSLRQQRQQLQRAVDRRVQRLRWGLGRLQQGLGDPRRVLSQKRVHVAHLADRLELSTRKGLRHRREGLVALEQRLEGLNPQARLQQTRAELSKLRLRLQSAISQRLRNEHRVQTQLHRRLERASPKPRMQLSKQRLKALAARLPQLIHQKLQADTLALSALARHLDALSPEHVLERGFSLARRADGRVVRAAGDVKPGEAISLQLSGGDRLEAQVTASTPGKKD